jgi:ubiquinone/menaquinone biosynthesis C-methylase UbiE
MTVKQPPICNYEGSDYQTSFWDQGDRAYEDRVEAIALRRLLPEKGKLLLEIGAGAGRNTPRYTGFERVVLLDYSLTQLQQAQARLGSNDRYVYVAGDAYRMPLISGLFDAATMIRVLHHMADAPLVLGQVRRVLAPGAVFILEFANKKNLKAIVRYALHRQAWNPFDRQPVEFVALNFDFHPAAVRDWLQAAGFKVQKQLTVSHFRMGVLKRLIPVSVLAGMDALVQWTGNYWQYTPSVFVRSQAVGGERAASQSGLFCCPECGCSPLEEQLNALSCPACGRTWRIVEGIYDFRQPA